MTVPLLPPGYISRDHAVVKKNLSSKYHFVLGSRFAWTCSLRAFACIYSFECFTYSSTRWLTPLYILIIPSHLVKLVYLL